MLNSKFSILLLFTFLLSFSIDAVAQLNVPPKPKEETSIYDYADMLTASEEQMLEQKLISYADTTSTQIVIATIESLQGEYIGLYAPKWAQEWGIGMEKEDNGLLILLSKEDRKIWITTGYGLEEYLTDFTSKDIIENIILPEFKNANIYGGLDKGTTAIFQVLDGSFEGSPVQSNKSTGIPVNLIIMGIFFIIFLISLAKKNKNNNGGPGSRGGMGSTILDAIILSSLGRGGFGGGSFGGGSSGGGFGGGFGGGGFGGGGAGGSW